MPRCRECNKRVGLLGFECKCGSTFCATHRMSWLHACSFDHAGAERRAIELGLPKVVARKVAVG